MIIILCEACLRAGSFSAQITTWSIVAVVLSTPPCPPISLCLSAPNHHHQRLRHLCFAIRAQRTSNKDKESNTNTNNIPATTIISITTSSDNNYNSGTKHMTNQKGNLDTTFDP